MPSPSHRSRRIAITIGIAALAVTLIAPAAGAANAKTKRVSVAQGGEDANDGSARPSTSANGRLVAFHSDATDLIGGDTNDRTDAFVYSTKKKKTWRVSRKHGGGNPNGFSYRPTVSADGRFVAFESAASDLIGNDSNAKLDIFVFDRQKKKTRRVSIKKGGGNANGDSFAPSISADGRFIAFESIASDLISNDNNGKLDIFVFDRKTKKTQRVSRKQGGGDPNAGSAAPSISGNGRFVAFESAASDLIGNDSNAKLDIFVFDRKKKKTRRVSIRKGGGNANGSSFDPSISADGRFVAFESAASDLIGNDGSSLLDIFVFDRKTKKTRRASAALGGGDSNDKSFTPSISGNGRYIAYESHADDLVSNDGDSNLDVFVFDRKKKKNKRMSIKKGGGDANGSSFHVVISADGRFVAFASKASDLVSNDGNTKQDIFRRGPLR